MNDLLKTLDEISTEFPQVFNECLATMTYKMNHLISLDSFKDYMLCPSYLQMLLLDEIRQKIAESTLGVAV